MGTLSRPKELEHEPEETHAAWRVALSNAGDRGFAQDVRAYDMREFVDKIRSAELGKTWLFSVGQAGFVVKSATGKLLGLCLD